MATPRTARRPLPTAETVMPSVTTLAQDQVQAPEASVEVVNKHFHDLLLKGDADGWIPWAGGECPVSKNIMIEYRTRGVRNVRTRRAGYATWSHRGWDSDIVAYRIAEPAPIMVPLGPEDVPPGSVFARLEDKPISWISTRSVGDYGVVLGAKYGSTKWTWLREKYRINRPTHRDSAGNPTLWERCEKEVRV